MIRRSIILAVLLLPALAGVSSAQSGWKWSGKQKKQLKELQGKVQEEGGRYRLESEHWQVTTEVPGSFTAELGLFMDLLFEAFGELMQDLADAPKVERKPAVHVFASEDGYRGMYQDGSRGHYEYKWNDAGEWTELHLYTFIQAKHETQFSRFYHPILMHEGVHVLMRRLLGKADNPKWFDEGVATFFQFWDLRFDLKRNMKTRYGRSIYRKHLGGALRDGPTLEGLIAIEDEETWNPDGMGPKAKRNYALGEAFANLLLSSKKHRPTFKRVFLRLREGEAPLLTADELGDLQPKWLRHMQKLSR